MRKALMVLRRCCMVAFLGYLVAGFLVPLPMAPGWVLLAVAVGAPVVVSRWPAGRGGPRGPVVVLPPVTGRWSALNSPASRVPSHGTRALGQTYAIDLVAEPSDGSRPRFGWWPPVRRATDFPAYGAPLPAVADGTVVRVTDGQRDHLSRNSVPALLYLLLEGVCRGLLGPGRLVGNHLVLDLGGGTYAMYAHLRRGSPVVRAGDRVRAGQVLARCGNSGNSSEPHVHFQLMDDPDLDVARGIPFSWKGRDVPRNGEIVSVGEPAEG